MAAKLEREEMSAKQIKDGIVALNWRDKRDVRKFTTKTSALKTVTTQTRKMPAIFKPEIIRD